MASTEKWTGASGKGYTYYIHKLPWRPKSGQTGNYIFAKQINNIWYAVYVGQGDLQDRYDAAMREGCVNQQGATHYHVHNNANRSARLAEEKDVIEGNAECKHPRGCNGKD